MPVYRISEGAENLKNNFNTFSKVHQLLQAGKIVLIFSEGRCVNEWHLRPLKKGTARIALRAWEEGIPLKVLPAGINYSSFSHFGKHVIINLGDIIQPNTTDHEFNGKEILNFNARLKHELSSAVYEIAEDDRQTRERVFGIPSTKWKKVLLWLPAIAGYVLHYPLYRIIHLLIKKRANAHYDSIMVGALFLGYPLYLTFIGGLVLLITGLSTFLLILFLMPITALALLHYRPVL